MLFEVDLALALALGPALTLAIAGAALGLCDFALLPGDRDWEFLVAELRVARGGVTRAALLLGALSTPSP